MGRVNILALLLAGLGLLLIFLGVTGRYKAFVGGTATSSAPAPSSPLPSLPNQGSVPASNTAIPGVTFNVLNQDPVPTLGNLPTSISPVQQSALQAFWQGLSHTVF